MELNSVDVIFLSGPFKCFKRGFISKYGISRYWHISAIVEAELAGMAEVFLPYAITKKGNTLYKEIENDNKILLLN